MNGSPSIDKLREFTCYPSGDESAPPPSHVVIVPSGGALAPGFARAEALLRSGDAVRLVAHCATLSAGWPSWVHDATKFSVSELGAYREGDRLTSTSPLRAQLRQWTDEVLGSSFSGLPGKKAFYGSAFTRILDPDATAILFVTSLLRAHPTARFHCVGPSWAGERMLAAAQRKTTPRASVREKAALVARWGGALLMTHVELTRRFAKAAPSRAALRARVKPATAPALWLALTPDWPRINRPLIDTFTSDPVLRDRAVGVLLVGNLFSGKRDELDLRKHTGGDLWPGVGELRESPHVEAYAQIAVSESKTELLRSLVQTTHRSGLALWRALRVMDDPRFDALAGTMRTNPLPVAKLLTMDIGRSTEAESATKRFLKRNSVAGSTVLFSATTHAEYVVPDLLLQAAGCRTVDFFHGWSGEPLPLASESEASVRSVWARSDISRENPAQVCIVAGMPRRIKHAAARSGPVRNILILSNYVHRDDLPNLPWALFQDELLATVPSVRAALGDRFVFRWRPHPADLVDRVDHAAARVAGLTVSRGVDLADDIGWCDALVSTMSTALIEALFAKIPIFGHVLPELVGTPTPAFLHPSRRFFRSGELAALIAQFEATKRTSPETALMPEEHARRALFGPRGEPVSLGAELFPTAAPRLGSSSAAHRRAR